ncbi:MAG: hypothetical protein H6Q00_1061 [Holophagaceae bacterium]|nr:hypothetical protein [Holophagaceae bacterium]
MTIQEVSSVLTTKDLHLLNLRGVSQGEQAEFAELLMKAQGLDAEDRQALLNRMTPRELEQLRKIHCFAAPIPLHTLSAEGAYNLFQAPTQAQDLDGDGFEEIGAALTSSFPPPGAPDSVKAAWEEATKGLSDGEIMLRSGLFLMPPQVQCDSEGNVQRVILPGDPDWKNPYTQPGFTWEGFLQAHLEGNEVSRPYNSEAVYRTNRDFLKRFLELLQDPRRT